MSSQTSSQTSQQQESPKQSATVLGATGLVGSHLLALLEDDPRYHKVIVITRSKIPQLSEKVDQHVIDFKTLRERQDLFRVDHVFCCIGTTIKNAGSEAAFERVDFHLPLLSARIARDVGAKHFLWISAVGADASSSVFYSKVKGELEDAIKALALPRFTAVRPSLLTGHRNEFRLAERVAIFFADIVSPLLKGKYARYRPIEAEEVARTMLAEANGSRLDNGLLVVRQGQYKK